MTVKLRALNHSTAVILLVANVVNTSCTGGLVKYHETDNKISVI